MCSYIVDLFFSINYNSHSDMKKNKTKLQLQREYDCRNDILFKAIMMSIIGFAIVCLIISKIQNYNTRQGTHSESVQVVVEKDYQQIKR